jgi:hypothetical protein
LEFHTEIEIERQVGDNFSGADVKCGRESIENNMELPENVWFLEVFISCTRPPAGLDFKAFDGVRRAQSFWLCAQARYPTEGGMYVQGRHT